MKYFPPNSVPALPQTPTGNNVPLGTATWGTPGYGTADRFKTGDLFLGFTQDGMALGLNDDRHACVTSGTRGGKGTSFIIQNLALWQGSVVVLDPKGENAMVTARRRGKGSKYTAGMGQTVRILDPFDAVKTDLDDFSDLKACFNPLDSLSADREESVDGAARIAESVIVSQLANDPFWEDSARLILKPVILHVATWPNFLPHERNLNTVRRLIMAGDERGRQLAALASGKKKPPSAFSLLIGAMKRNKALGGAIADAAGMISQLEQSPRTLASVLQVVCTNLDFLESPAIKRCVARSDFSLAELKTNPRGMSLYLCLPQRYMESHYRWQRMMVTLILAEMERIRTKPATGHPVLMVLDEFPALRRMKSIENAAAQIAGFGVKLMFVCQTLAQLKDIYKDNWETLLANAGVKLFFCNDDHFTREYASKLVGECEVVRTGHSASNTSGESRGSSRSATSGSSFSTTHGSSFGGASPRTGMPTGSTSGSSTKGFSQSATMSDSYSASRSASEGHSESIQRRPLITPDEVGRLFGDRNNPTALALITGHQPLFLKRKFYFDHEWLLGYFDPHPDHPLPLTSEQAQIKKKKREEYERALDVEEKRMVQLRKDMARKYLRDKALQQQLELEQHKESTRQFDRILLREKILYGGGTLAIIILSIAFLVYTFA